MRERVLGAVREALESGDPAALAIDRLAERSGVHRATIYRRWVSTGGLVADLLAGLTPVRTPLPDTGVLRDDLAAVAERVAATVATPVAGTTLKVVAGSSDPRLAAAAARYWASVLDHTADVVRRAQARGEATADVDAVEAIESLLGPIYLRFFLTGQALTPVDTERLADRTARLLAIRG